MSAVTRCDQCHRDLAINRYVVEWVDVVPRAARTRSGPWDFCSPRCLSLWAAEQDQ